MKKEKNNLNMLETSIINEIIEYNKGDRDFIKAHLPFVRVKSRDITGVGVYVNFEYSREELEFVSDTKKNIVLSSDKSLEIDTLKYGVNYELNITDGKLDFLELVTNGESWDGNYESYDIS